MVVETADRLATSDEPAVVVTDLVKCYGGRAVVDGLSFRVAAGEVFALLGPNGAGKTTTVEILEGYRRPDTGSVRVLGLDPHRQPADLKPRVGLMLQQGGVYPTATPLETLRLFASFFRHPLDPRELLGLVGLEDAAQTRYRRLSGGQKQRLSLALALVGRPQLLFLDEPTMAMDPQARQATWELIRDLKASGATILLTTHFMDEAERLADRVAIVERGRLVALDTPGRLIEGASGGRGGPGDRVGGGRTAAVRFVTRPELPLDQLSSVLGGCDVVAEAPGHYLARLDPSPALLAALAVWLRDRDVRLVELRTGHRNLEDVFLELTGRELRD